MWKKQNEIVIKSNGFKAYIMGHNLAFGTEMGKNERMVKVCMQQSRVSIKKCFYIRF